MKRSKPRGSSRPRASEIPLRPTLYAAALGGILFIGALLRILAAQGELWLDEIWSYRLAHLASSSLRIFELHNDNNHYLNTLYLRLIPEGTTTWWLYRLPAIVLGSGTVLFAALIARQRSAWAALAAAALTATSFPLVVYSSEARGYAIAVFFAFACLLATRRYLASRRIGWGIAAGCAAMFGILGHLTFLHALAGVAAWVMVSGWKVGTRRLVVDLAIVFTLPAATLVLLYLFDLRYLQIGGGPLTSAGDIAAGALALSAGGPDEGGWKVMATLVAFVCALASIAAVHRSGSDMWIVFLVTVILAPALTLAVVDTGVVYERYLLVAAAFMLLSYAWLVQRIFTRWRAVAAALIVVFIIANAARIWEFVRYGRSNYTAALAEILNQTPASTTTLGSDHDFRNGRVVEFYRPVVAGGERIRYQMQGEWSSGGPDWLLVHRIEPVFEPRTEITVLGGYRYRLVRAYPYPGVSGWHLALYRNLREAP